MTDEHDDVLSELRAELAGVAPSPAFAAAVRRRVADASTARRTFTWWVWPVGLAGAAGLVLAAFLASGREAAVAIPARGSDVALASNPPVALPAMPVQSQPEVSRPRPRLSMTTSAVVPAGPREAVPENLQDRPVITNQSEMIRAVWVHANRQAVEVSAEVLERPDSAREISLAPIQVEPILVPVLEPGAAGSGGIPVIRKVAADATRSER